MEDTGAGAQSPFLPAAGGHPGMGDRRQKPPDSDAGRSGDRAYTSYLLPLSGGRRVGALVRPRARAWQVHTDIHLSRSLSQTSRDLMVSSRAGRARGYHHYGSSG